MKYTIDQQKVIDSRGKNILVSASAGSGKTAVLVARIMKMVCEEGVDIDRLLIVTFTNAAAAEMKERIHSAIMEKLEEEPSNEHLQRQVVLLMNAQITTIHSFCMYLLRNHFEQVDLDPGFRMGDEGEMKLLRNDTLDELLEDSYEKGSENFLYMIESLTSIKDDGNIKEYILKLYEFAMSNPWPKEWLDSTVAQYYYEDFEESPWFEFLMSDVKAVLEDCRQELQEALDITQETDGPYMYEEAIASDLEILQALLKEDTYQGMYERYSSLKHATLGRKKDDSVSEEKKEQVKSLRDNVKKIIKSQQEKYFSFTKEEIGHQLESAGRLVTALVECTKEFIHRFAEKKKEISVVDFHDLEHFAIKILTDENKEYTAVARELQEHFVEVMTDEYQDSNLVQEMILTAVSKVPLKGSNLFMVGDVKQGIYRFRLARPELFMEKHDLYQRKEVEDSTRIDLHQNFRSRETVLKTINFIFYQLMRKELGNIQYDEGESLVPGSNHPKDETKEFATQILLIETEDQGDKTVLAEDEEATKTELEARMIAHKIKDMVGKKRVFDKKRGEYRPCKYSDMVILMRSVKGSCQEFMEILKEYDIPVLVTSTTGYFHTTEVQTILSMLAVLDNPLQDIPMAAVLSSPIAGLDATDLATIKGEFKEERFAKAVKLYVEEGKDESVREKLEAFWNLVDELRKELVFLPLHQLIEKVYEETGYLNYVTAMPGGNVRAGNLAMLVEKAYAYESSCYQGLFHFLRYMDQLQQYDVDFGQASLDEEAEDAVQIMSIHKSKGLEFPICFVAMMHKTFNLMDTNSKLCMDLDYGIGVDCYDVNLRRRTPTLFKKVMARKQVLETVAEELRILYVALTRAEDLLILTAVKKDIPKELSKCSKLAKREETRLSACNIADARSYLTWILLSMYRHPAMTNILEELALPWYCKKPLPESEVDVDIQISHYSEIVSDFRDYKSELFQQARGGTEDSIKNPEYRHSFITSKEKYQQAKIKLEECFEKNSTYPYELHEGIRSKVSVSELKINSLEKELEQQGEEERLEEIFETHVKKEYIPDFVQEKEEESGGTIRGNAYHKFMELTAHEDLSEPELLRKCQKEIIAQGRMSEEQIKLLDEKRLLLFYSSELAKRMRKAYGEGKLFREQPFMMGRDISQIYQDRGYQEEETILVQGIIDAFFEEDGKIILVDYKTDRVDAPQKLAQRYKEQLMQYADALKSLKNKEVSEQILYSFSLGCTVDLKKQG